MSKLAIIFGQESKSYAFPSGHPMSKERAISFWRELKNQGFLNSKEITFHQPTSASENELLFFHNESYINFVRKSSERGSGNLDYGDTPVFKGIYEASSCVVGSTLKALDLIMSGSIDHAFNPIGGLHHAKKESAAGFCVFNDAAVAISKAESHYKLKKIMYIDIDAHHGDGVFYAFYDNPRVFIADIHEDGKFLYPGSGSQYETGRDNSKGTKLPLPLSPNSGDEEFLKAFEKVEDFIKEIEPDIILFQSGADGLESDPLTHLKYTTQAYSQAAARIHHLAHKLSGGRILVMGGGGYDPLNTSKAWIKVVKALSSE
jgi:acetoin utilization protein AcuC